MTDPLSRNFLTLVCIVSLLQEKQLCVFGIYDVILCLVRMPVFNNQVYNVRYNKMYEIVFYSFTIDCNILDYY